LNFLDKAQPPYAQVDCAASCCAVCVAPVSISKNALPAYPSSLENMPLSSDDDFEYATPRKRSGCLKHVEVVDVLEDGVTDTYGADLTLTSSEARQVFYFSKQMFEYMCKHGTAERISQEAARIATVRNGVLLKRQEAHSRSEKLREFVSEKGLQKPSCAEIAQLRRKKNARKKNTDQIMGRNPDQRTSRNIKQQLSCGPVGAPTPQLPRARTHPHLRAPNSAQLRCIHGHMCRLKGGLNR